MKRASAASSEEAPQKRLGFALPRDASSSDPPALSIDASAAPPSQSSMQPSSSPKLASPSSSPMAMTVQLESQEESQAENQNQISTQLFVPHHDGTDYASASGPSPLPQGAEQPSTDAPAASGIARSDDEDEGDCTAASADLHEAVAGPSTTSLTLKEQNAQPNSDAQESYAGIAEAANVIGSDTQGSSSLSDAKTDDTSGEDVGAAATGGLATLPELTRLDFDAVVGRHWQEQQSFKSTFTDEIMEELAQLTHVPLNMTPLTYSADTRVWAALRICSVDETAHKYLKAKVEQVEMMEAEDCKARKLMADFAHSIEMALTQIELLTRA